jgi:hypothetical protein
LQDKPRKVLINDGAGPDFDTLSSLFFAVPDWNKPRAERFLADSKGVLAAKNAVIRESASTKRQLRKQEHVSECGMQMTSSRNAQLAAALGAAKARSSSHFREHKDAGTFITESNQSYRTLGFRRPITYTVQLQARHD